MFKRLLLAIFIPIAIATVALWTLPAKADIVVTEVSIEAPAEILPRGQYVVTATGFAANELASIYLQPDGTSDPGVRLTDATTRADGTGQLVITVTIPTLRLPAGAAQFRAQDREIEVNVVTPTVVSPVVYVNTSGVVASPLTVEAFAFAPSEVYTATFTDDVDLEAPNCIGGSETISETLSVGTVSSGGSLKFESTIPEVDPGTYNVVIIGHESQACTIDE